MINGNSLIIQFGKESTYGTISSATRQIKVASEDLKPTYNKKEEGLLTGGKGASKKEIMSLKTEGSISTLARPDDVGLFLMAGLGTEASVVSTGDGAYKHTFTAVGTGLDDSLPSIFALMDRKTDVFSYNGLKVDSLSFSAEPEDYLKLDVSLVGKEEGTGASLTDDLTVSPLKAFKFRHGKVRIDNTEVADITSIKFEYSNNLDSSTQTTDTGLYFKEPEAGTRTIKTDLEMIYTEDTEALRNSLYKTDKSASIDLIFTSDEEIVSGVPYSLKITIPANQVSDSSANFGSADTVKQSMSFEAFDNNSDELITVELTNGFATQY